MNELLPIAGWLALGAGIGLVTASAGQKRGWFKSKEKRPLVAPLVEAHFHPTPLENISIWERRFPFRVRADLQRAIDALFDQTVTVCHFCGVRKEYSRDDLGLADCLLQGGHAPALSVPPEYEEVDVGDEEPVRCLKNGIWFLKRGDEPFVVLLAPHMHYGESTGVQFQIGAINHAAGTRLVQEFFSHLERSVLEARSYRGKILSLEKAEHSYSGESSGITVHQLRTVAREQVILPRKTLDLLDRNVIEFVRQRPHLARLKQATKKGILFYGPPGTGKTHTIHYLAKALTGHTTLLVTAEQVGLLEEYMTLARLLQPSIVVIEDVDLIARDRSELNTCEEVLLNKLLNEMDGLREEADILFLLTTNRPEVLERALASRPGRIDQAIEFPLPDAEGREKLVRLYSQGLSVPDDVVEAIVLRTQRVSAAFIKELMRRSAQFHLEKNGSGQIRLGDVENALDEMIFAGGSLNLKLLGAEGIDACAERIEDGDACARALDGQCN
jgi:hypothetical protein